MSRRSEKLEKYLQEYPVGDSEPAIRVAEVRELVASMRDLASRASDLEQGIRSMPGPIVTTAFSRVGDDDNVALTLIVKVETAYHSAFLLGELIATDAVRSIDTGE
jgi:hypothetical protein